MPAYKRRISGVCLPRLGQISGVCHFRGAKGANFQHSSIADAFKRLETETSTASVCRRAACAATWVKLFSASMKRCKVSLQVGVAFEDGVRNKFSSVEHLQSCQLQSPNSFSSIDNRNLNSFPCKLNLFTNK